MAKVYNVNVAVTTGAEAIFTLKTTLKAAGWTVPKSSDGSTYNSSGDQISHAGSGAGGMANNSAWFVIREPGGLREWCIQRGTTNVLWRVKISACDLFTGGSPNATHTPTATDQFYCIGGGTDASPTFTTSFASDGSYRYHCIAMDSSVGTAAPSYPFYAFTTQNGTLNMYHLCMQEALLPGSYPELSSGTRSAPVVGDPDPVFYMFTYEGSTPNNVVNITSSAIWQHSSTNAAKGWYMMNYVGEAATTFEAAVMAGDYATLDNMGSNPYNGGDDSMFIHMSRPPDYSTYVGNKGICNGIRYRMMDRGEPAYPNTINLSSSEAYVYAYRILIPWPTGVTPL